MAMSTKNQLRIAHGLNSFIRAWHTAVSLSSPSLILLEKG
ncbi:hypothetical protein F383_13569 [Gossypium arboreum]|uniref:Uncharacterized protein n=1 Tax=Gossypium arboreum TaxID=29729 RepID=A0A0B0PSV2_GOSAR|nr:hypothetical protein F383_13569 [Gossypium arboreum]